MTETIVSTLSPATQEWLNRLALNPEDLLPKEPQTGLVGELAQYLARDAGANFDCFQTLAPYSDITIGSQTPVSRLRLYTHRLFETLQKLDPNEDANYPSLTDMEQLDGQSLSQLYLQATQMLIGQVSKLNHEDALLERVAHQDMPQIKWA